MRKELAFFFYFVFLVALLCSRTLLTIAMVGIVAIGVFEVNAKPFRIGLNPLFFKNILTIFKRKDFLALIGIFGLVLLGSLNFSSSPIITNSIRVQLPFLILPIAFLQLPDLSKKELSNLFYTFLILTTIACIGIGVNYALDFKYITNSINLGKSIPTPIHHIRFSLLVALATSVGVWLTYNGHFWRKPWEKYLIGGLTCFTFVFQHILSVRSGLVVMYAALGLMAIYFIVASKKLWLFAIFAPMMVIMPLVAYWTIPSLQNKIRYLKHDLDMMRHGNLDGFSDGQRFISWEMGGKVVKNNPVLGVGFGDLKEELALLYKEKYPELKPKLPHNQFLTFAAAMGFVGLAAFIFLFFIPLFYQKHHHVSVFIGFYTIITLSFLFENTLATAFGVGIYLFFTLVLLRTDWKN